MTELSIAELMNKLFVPLRSLALKNLIEQVSTAFCCAIGLPLRTDYIVVAR